LSQKIGSLELDWRPGPGQVGNKNAKSPLLVTFPQENPKPKTEFFFSRNYKSCRICRWFEHLSSFSSWRVMAKKVPFFVLVWTKLNMTTQIPNRIFIYSSCCSNRHESTLQKTNDTSSSGVPRVSAGL